MASTKFSKGLFYSFQHLSLPAGDRRAAGWRAAGGVSGEASRALAHNIGIVIWVFASALCVICNLGAGPPMRLIFDEGTNYFGCLEKISEVVIPHSPRLFTALHTG